MHLTRAGRLGTWGLILIFSGSLVLPALSARHITPDADDPLAQVSTHAPLAVTTGDAPDGGEHCPVCHWLRAISGASAQAPAAIAVTGAPAGCGPARPASRLGRSEVPAIPSRAPPSVV